MNCKTTYTRPELTRRSTEQLIRIYNRLFNTNAFDEWFNPFEHRQDMLLALLVEMEAQKVLAQWEINGAPFRYQKPLQIYFSIDGIAIIWKQQFVVNVARKFDVDLVKAVHYLHADGKSIRQIAAETGLKKNRVNRILKGIVYADVSI